MCYLKIENSEFQLNLLDQITIIKKKQIHLKMKEKSPKRLP